VLQADRAAVGGKMGLALQLATATRGWTTGLPDILAVVEIAPPHTAVKTVVAARDP
jgi:hypothetical protein